MSILVSTTKAPDYFSRQVRHARRFYLDRRPRRAALSVVCGGWERCTSDYAIDRNTFPWFAIEFVFAGRLSAQLSGRAYTLGPGAVFSYGPGIAQRLRPLSREPLWKYFVDFGGRRAADALRSAGLAPGSVRQIGDVLAVREIMDALISSGLRRTPRSNAICTSLVEALLLTIGDGAVGHVPAASQSYSTYQRCRGWIVEGDGKAASLQEVADACHVDAAYLCRLFARFDRETPYQLIQRLRLQRAATLLTGTDALVKTVAATLGYPDPFHFSHAFKKHFGISPAQFAHGVRPRPLAENRSGRRASPERD